MDYATIIAEAERPADISRRCAEALQTVYFARSGELGIPGRGPWDRLLWALDLEKALYEVRYELAHRPSWGHMPLLGLRRLLGGAG